MKIEVIERKENTMYVRLMPASMGGVRLVACNKDGKPLAGGNLVMLSNDGSINLYSCICFQGADKMLQLDHRGKIKVNNNNC